MYGVWQLSSMHIVCRMRNLPTSISTTFVSMKQCIHTSQECFRTIDASRLHSSEMTRQTLLGFSHRLPYPRHGSREMKHRSSPSDGHADVVFTAFEFQWCVASRDILASRGSAEHGEDWGCVLKQTCVHLHTFWGVTFSQRAQPIGPCRHRSFVLRGTPDCENLAARPADLMQNRGQQK